MPLFGQMKMYGRFAWGLRGFLREPITLEQSRRIIRQRLQNRERNLLLSVQRAVYGNKASPYLKLLKFAGCEYGDFEKMVRSEGVEPGLKKLAREGVYIDIEEFKGKKETKRGARVFKFKESDFDNPFLSGHLEAGSSASRSAGTRTMYDFNYGAAIGTVYYINMFDAFSALKTPFAIWRPIMPGTGPGIMMVYAKAGKTPAKWFSPVEKRRFKPSLMNRAGTDFIIYMGRLSGTKLPRPEYVSLDEAWRIAEWMSGVINKRGSCGLNSYASLAVRVCQAAKERNIELTGAKFFIGGEPITEAKRKEIESVGAEACPLFGFSEGGILGLGCSSPAVSDDMHFCKDSFALIQQRKEVPYAATSVEAFLFSTLLPAAPKILLNVESGDWGMTGTRKCGCKLEELGFTEHIYHIRGFDKLTGEGMTFVGTDMVRIIEEVLPAEFGGASFDYQMLEVEDEQGHTRISIVASPGLGTINETDLIKTVLAELCKGKDSQRMMTEMWAQAKTLRVKRTQPFTTMSGKLMPLHIHKH